MSIDDTQAQTDERKDTTWSWLEDQIAWYDAKSHAAQQWYRTLKVVELMVAAMLPVVAGVGAPAVFTGSLGATVVVLEGVQHLFQFHGNWILYRSTAESLKHERYMYVAAAGPYSGSSRHTLLAERIGGLISREHARWTETQHRVQAQSSTDRAA